MSVLFNPPFPGSKRSLYVPIDDHDPDDDLNDHPQGHDVENSRGSSSVVPNTDKFLLGFVSMRVWAALVFVAGLLLVLSAFPAPRARLALSAQLGLLGLDRGVPYGAVDHPEPVSPLWGAVSKPYPTGAFWTNLVVEDGDGAVALYPYAVKTLASTVQVSYSAYRRVVKTTAVTDPFMNDLEVSFAQNILSHAVESYDNVSVTMMYRSYENNGNAKMKAHLVKGSPFVTFAFEDTTPLISSPLFKIVKMEKRDVPGSRGSQHIVTLGNGQKWLVFCSDPDKTLSLDEKNSVIRASSPMRGFVRVAILPTQSFEQAFALLMKYVQKYPTGATVSFAFPTPSSAVVTLQYNTVGTGPLLMLALPHHIPLLPEGLLNSEASKDAQKNYFPVYCIKGPLKGVVGEVWRLSYMLSPLVWNYALNDKLSTSQLNDIAESLFADVKTVPPTGADPYLFGKQMGRMARLALIADNLGISDARQQAIFTLETSIIPWLQSMNHDILHYDRTYGGLVPSYGLQNKLADFGSGWYSDHHFHFGYFAHVVAVLAKLDMPFYEANKAGLEAFIRDICTFDSSDPDFPFVRHKDLFDGHSWASGLFQQANGKGQESSSEAVNAYYGCALFGMATGNTDLQRLAQLMTAMEIQSTQTYWHISNDDIYDSLFASNRMVGNVGSLDVTSSTWFGEDVEYVHGINLMPLSPITCSLFDQSYVKLQYPVVAQALNKVNKAKNSEKCSDYSACSALGLLDDCCPTQQGVILGCCEMVEMAVGDEWRALIYSYLAVLDRNSAWKLFAKMNDFGVGNSRTNSLFWAATRSPPVVGYNTSQKPPAPVVKTDCASNTGCYAIGMLGECCPTETGLYLNCCPPR